MAYQNKAFPPLPPKQITQQQGYSFTLQFASDVSALQYDCELRSGPGATAPIEFTVDMDHAADDHTVTFSLDGSLTVDMAPGEYVFDVWETDPVTDVSRPIYFRRVVINATITEIGDTLP